jgi:hypothetical protein
MLEEKEDDSGFEIQEKFRADLVKNKNVKNSNILNIANGVNEDEEDEDEESFTCGSDIIKEVDVEDVFSKILLLLFNIEIQEKIKKDDLNINQIQKIKAIPKPKSKTKPKPKAADIPKIKTKLLLKLPLKTSNLDFNESFLYYLFTIFVHIYFALDSNTHDANKLSDDSSDSKLSFFFFFFFDFFKFFSKKQNSSNSSSNKANKYLSENKEEKLDKEDKTNDLLLYSSLSPNDKINGDGFLFFCYLFFLLVKIFESP